MDIDIEVVDDSREGARRGGVESARPQVLVAFNGDSAVVSSARFLPALALFYTALPGTGDFEVAHHIQ